MKNLTKGAMPRVLERNGARWTTEFVAETTAEGRKRTGRWRHAEIHEALTDETGGRCAYCECSVEPGAHYHVEHVLPKSARPELAHSWDNLTHACPKCNENKGDYHNPAEPLLDPYSEDVESKTVFLGNMIWPRPGVDFERADFTIERIDLNRLGLIDDRKGRIKAVANAVQRWASAPPGARKRYLEEGIRIDALEGEYTVAVREYLTRMGFPIMSNATKRS